MRLARGFKYVLLALITVAACAANAAASAITVDAVTGTKVGVYIFGQVATPNGTQFDRLAVSFTTPVGLTDVTIDVGLGSVNSPVQAYLVNSLGAGTTIANQIAQTTYSGPAGSNVVLFTNLTLNPGTFFLVLDAGTPSDSWNRLLPFTVTTAAGVTRGQDFFATQASAYAPAAQFFVNPNTSTEGALQYRVVGTAVPEPATCLLVGAGLAFAARRKSSMIDE